MGWGDPVMTAIGTTHTMPGEASPRPQPRFRSAMRWPAALGAVFAGVLLPAEFYAPHNLPVVILVAAITIAADRILGAVGKLIEAGRRGSAPALPVQPGSRPPMTPPYGPASYGPPPQQQYEPPQQHGSPPPQQHGSPPPPPSSGVRPLVFVGRSQLGPKPWRLPRRMPALHGVEADEALAGDLDIRATSVVGPAHRFDPEADGHRQDTYRLGLSADGQFLVAAVADGVSNAARSQDGAKWAASTAVEYLRLELARNSDHRRLQADRLFAAVANRMKTHAERIQVAPKALASTLIVAVIPTSAGRPGQRTAWLGWVADSSGWQLEAGRWRRVTGLAKSGYDPNALDGCLPADPHLAKSALIVLQTGQALALMTDGLSDLLTDVGGAQEELAKRWSTPPTLPAFVRDLCFDAPGQDDDRTAVVIWTPGHQGGS